MKFFTFDWFRSKERRELEELKVLKETLEIEILEKKLEEIEQVGKRPYQKLINNNGNVTAILRGGVVMDKKDVSAEVFTAIKNALTEAEIISLMAITTALPPEEGAYTDEELTIIKDNVHILSNHPDFEFKKDMIFLKGVQLPLEPVVTASFIEIAEKINALNSESTEDDVDILDEAHEALKMFWRWTALNPIASSRQDLYSFIRTNDIKITAQGMLELYRRVVSTGKADKELINFISGEYFRIKKAKKGPKNYEVFECTNDGTVTYVLGTSIADPKIQAYNRQTLVGNLAELYTKLPEMGENTYTDAYTHTKMIKVGSVYAEDESNIDLDNRQSCSRGLHVGSRSFGFSGNGDTGVVALVNPMKVRSVPVGYTNKMRVSEMFIAGVLELSDYKDHVDSEYLNDYGEEYFKIGVEELEAQLAAQTLDGLGCQGNVTPLVLKDVADITAYMKSRVVTI